MKMSFEIVKGAKSYFNDILYLCCAVAVKTLLNEDYTMDSKFSGDEVMDLRITYDYHGSARTMVTDMPLSVLYSLTYSEFEECIKQDIPYLRRLPCIRLYIFDDNEYVDMTQRNFKKLMLKHSTLKLKVLDGTSPAPAALAAAAGSREPSDNPAARKELVYETKDAYLSPAELDIKAKELEVEEKVKMAETMDSKYKELSTEMNTHVWRDKSKRVCHNCHQRLGHDKKKCSFAECEDVRVCGEVDLHPESKKELNTIGIKRQKIQGELEALRTELDAKRKAYRETHNTFEGKVQPFLIRSDPEKYLIRATGQVRQVRVNADIAILRTILNGKVPEDMAVSCKSWPQLIEAFEKKYDSKKTSQRKSVANPVRQELETRGIVWPNPTQTASTGFTGNQGMPFGMPQYFTAPFYMYSPPPPGVVPTATVTSADFAQGDYVPPLPTEPYPEEQQPPLPQDSD